MFRWCTTALLGFWPVFRLLFYFMFAYLCSCDFHFLVKPPDARSLQLTSKIQNVKTYTTMRAILRGLFTGTNRIKPCPKSCITIVHRAGNRAHTPFTQHQPSCMDTPVRVRQPSSRGRSPPASTTHSVASSCAVASCSSPATARCRGSKSCLTTA